ncbi:hypothetical protein [Haladaptatus sp. ZSTT2]|uniref:hypothetical protein n=1 Tax=Haladaptatus sp. ZSTT2 TaxID=3120515 RepID=UPI00300EB267
MFDVKVPPYGFARITLAFWGYVAVALGITLVVHELGVPTNLAVYVFIEVGALLFPVFLPLFRRLMPGGKGGE